MRFLVGQPPATAAADSDEQRYYNWLTSEYIVNALTDWVQGHEFGQAVSEELARRGLEVAPAAVQGGLAADNARSMFTLSLVHSDPQQLAAIMDAAVVVLKEHNAQVLPQLGDQPAIITPLDEPVVNPLPASISAQLDLPLRLAVALVVGTALALVVEYVDPTVRERQELEKLGYSVIAEIPKEP
jgi:capsular polysaccharide biosynthesis protein